MTLLDPIRVTLRVTAVFEQLGVPYWIAGSMASTLYGMVRTTQDSDIVAELPEVQVQAFIQALQDDFYMDDQMIAAAVALRSSFNIIHRESMFKVDVFIPRQRHFEQMQLSRARFETLSHEPQARAMVCSPEDILLAKLEWFRLGGEVSERQWRDVIGVLKVQAGALDLDYLRRMAGELAVEDLLERALNQR